MAMPQNQDFDLINVTEAAAILNISARAVRHRALAGKLPAQKLGTGTASYVFRRVDIEAAAKAAA